MPGMCSGGAFAFGGANLGPQGKPGAGGYGIVGAEYSPDKGWVEDSGVLVEGFASNGRGGGAVISGHPEGLVFVPVSAGAIPGGHAEAGAFYGANMSKVPVSIGVFGEVEGGKHGIFSLAAGGGAYLNFTNATTCAAMMSSGRK